MFSLIITIVSVALVAALAVATIYYGSDAAEKGRISARAGAIVSAGEQVAAGLSIYRLNTGRWPDTLETMVTEKYLNGLPEIAAADSLSFIASAHAAPAVEGDWLYDPDTPHLAYVKPISLEVCAEVNRRISGRRMVLNVLDPGIKVQCAAAGGDPVVVFRNSEVPLTTPPAIPGAPSVGSGGEFGEVGRVIDTEGEDTSGRCVYACEPGGAGSGGAGTGGDGGTAEPPPPQPPVTLEPSLNEWVPEGIAYCSPELGDDELAMMFFSEVFATKTMRAVVTGERYVSSEAGDDMLYIDVNWSVGSDYGWGALEFSGEGEGWVPFTYSTEVMAGAQISVAGTYAKGASGSAGEDRACLRGVKVSFEATDDTESEGVEPEDLTPQPIAATCVMGGMYVGPDGGFWPEDFQEMWSPKCSPFVFPSDWNIAGFGYAILEGEGFSPNALSSLQAPGWGVRGVWTTGDYLYDVPSQTATLTAYTGEGAVIGVLPVTIEQAPNIASATRLDKPYNLFAYGVPSARYEVAFTTTDHSPRVMPGDGISPLSANTFELSDTGYLSDWLSIEHIENFSSSYNFAERYRYDNAGGVSNTLGKLACTSTGKDIAGFKFTVSRASDNPYGANIVSQDRSAASSALTVSFLDLPESAPHSFSVSGPYTATVKDSVTSNATPAELSAYVENSGLIRYTYSLGLAASGVSSGGSLSVYNRFGKYNGVSVSLASSNSNVSSLLWGAVTCTDPDFDPDVVTLPDEG